MSEKSLSDSRLLTANHSSIETGNREQRCQMISEQHALLMSEFDKITEKVNAIAPEARESAFNILASTLLNGSAAISSEADHIPQIQDGVFGIESKASKETEDRDYIVEIMNVMDKFNLQTVGAKHFAKYVVYYLTKVAPAGQRLEFVTPDDLKTIWSVVGRKPPANSNYNRTLLNAKADGHLECPSSGQYVLTDIGEYFVKNELLKEKN